MTFIYAFTSVLAVSLISLIGLFTLSVKEDVLKRYILVLVSLAAGALIGDAFIHLIPTSFEQITDTTLVSTLIIVGVLIFFIIEKFLHWHQHTEGDHENDLESPHNTETHVKPVGKLILFSGGVHNMIDGIIIGASYIAGIEIGIATTLAVILHEIPHEIGDFGVLIHSGYTRIKALVYNFYSALSAVIGLGIAYMLQQYADTATAWFLPVAAGGFIYIAIADLIPELHKSHKPLQSLMQIIALFAGVLAMYALLALE